MCRLRGASLLLAARWRHGNPDVATRMVERILVERIMVERMVERIILDLVPLKLAETRRGSRTD